MPFENAMPEDPGAQDAELDFEGQAEAAEQQPAAPEPTYQPAPQYEPEPQQQAEPQQPEYSQAELYEWLSEVAEEDPLQAADFLARAHAAQMQEAMQAQMAPVVEDYQLRQDQQLADSLTERYGEETLAAVMPQLTEFVQANEGILRNNPDALGSLLSTAIDSILYRGGPQPVDPDAEAIAQMGEPGRGPQDHFGTTQGNGPQIGAGRRSVGNVFVERGSTPPPPVPAPMTVEDAIKAEIDGTGGSRSDIFGRIRPLARP